jgi:hypothetical protein
MNPENTSPFNEPSNVTPPWNVATSPLPIAPKSEPSFGLIIGAITAAFLLIVGIIVLIVVFAVNRNEAMALDRLTEFTTTSERCFAIGEDDDLTETLSDAENEAFTASRRIEIIACLDDMKQSITRLGEAGIFSGDEQAKEKFDELNKVYYMLDTWTRLTYAMAPSVAIIDKLDREDRVDGELVIAFYNDVINAANSVDTGIADLDNWAHGFARDLERSLEEARSEEITITKDEFDTGMLWFLLGARQQMYQSVGLDVGQRDGFVDDINGRANELKEYLQSLDKTK